MRISRRRSPRKLVALAGFLFASLVVHQLSYLTDCSPTEHILEALELIEACRGPRIKQSNRPHWAGSSIPNVVHQIWKTADVRTYPGEASHDTWKAVLLPRNYSIKLWTDKDVHRLIATRYSWLLSTYEGYPQDIQRADIARLVVVHAEGGIYADLDVYPRSVEGILCLQNLGLQGVFAPTSGSLGLSNHFFMTEQGSTFLESALSEAKRRGGPVSKRILLPYLQVFWSTGPIMITTAFLRYTWTYNKANRKIGLLDELWGSSLIEHAAGRSWHSSDGFILNLFTDYMAERYLWLALILSIALLRVTYIVVRRSITLIV